jgi:hypothetical protein
MDIQNKLIKIPINDNKDIIVFVAILMSFYSSYIRDLILNKQEKNKNTLLFIIKKLLKIYYNENEETINFFNIITPEILLLKFLMLSNNNKLRKKIILNNNFNIPITLLYNFYIYFNLNCFNIITINRNPNFYCDTNNFYDYYYDKTKNKINYKLNNTEINNFISNKLESNIQILMIQKENKTAEANIVQVLINEDSYIDDILNLKNYHDTTKINNFEEQIYFNNNNYILDSCIIKSNINDNYLILLHFEKNKYIYDINNNILIKYNWNNLNKFKYNEFDFQLSPSSTTIYIII